MKHFTLLAENFVRGDFLLWEILYNASVMKFFLSENTDLTGTNIIDNLSCGFYISILKHLIKQGETMRNLGKLFVTILLFATLNEQTNIGNGFYSFNERRQNDLKKQYETEKIQNSDTIDNNINSQSGNAAVLWAQQLLADGSYGKPVAYCANWYDTLSDVEKLARTIYSEGGTSFTDEENGVASVILNRAYAYSQSVQNIVQGGNQFAALTGDETQSRYAREPAVNTPKWEHSTYLACLLLTITDKAEWDAVIGNPVGSRMCFASYSSARSFGDAVFRDNASTGDIEYCDGGVWKPVKNVYVIGYGDVTSIGALFSGTAVPDNYSRNIYYEYQ